MPLFVGAAAHALARCARLAGETELRAAAQWIRLRKGWIIQHLHLRRATLPCAGTYAYALEKIDAQELLEVVAGCLTRWEAAERCENEPSRLAEQGGQQVLSTWLLA